MRKQYLHTLPIALMTQMHKQIARGHRSQFVETAIRNRLSNKEDFNAGDIPDRQLMALLHTRLEGRKDAAALMVREFLIQELAK